jgi:hypothetical protein
MPKTVVDGREFVVLADPFSFVSKTLCTACGEDVELGDVTWSDTSESILAFRQRIRAQVSPMAGLWAYAVGPLIGHVVGGIAGACWPPHKPPDVVAGAICGAIVGWLVLQTPARQHLGMDFRRQV